MREDLKSIESIEDGQLDEEFLMQENPYKIQKVERRNSDEQVNKLLIDDLGLSVKS